METTLIAAGPLEVTVRHVLRDVCVPAFATANAMTGTVRKVFRDEDSAKAHAGKHGLYVMPLCDLPWAEKAVEMLCWRGQLLLDAIDRLEEERTEEARQLVRSAAGDLRDAMTGSPV